MRLERLFNKETDVFLQACKGGDVDSVVSQLASTPKLICSRRSIGGNTAWHYAARHGHVRMLEALVDFMYDYESGDKDHVEDTRHVFPWVAAKRCALQRLSSAVDCQNGRGQTPLMLACENGHFDNVQFLLGKGASIAIMDNNRYTCLHYAVCAEDLTIANHILAYERSHPVFDTSGSRKYPRFIDWQTVCGLAPLHFAVWSGCCDMVRCLLEYSAALSVYTVWDGSSEGVYCQPGSTAMHIAARRGDGDMIRILLYCQVQRTGSWASPARDMRRRVDYFGKRPLDIAEVFGHNEVAWLLDISTPLSLALESPEDRVRRDNLVVSLQSATAAAVAAAEQQRQKQLQQEQQQELKKQQQEQQKERKQQQQEQQKELKQQQQEQQKELKQQQQEQQKQEQQQEQQQQQQEHKKQQDQQHSQQQQQQQGRSIVGPREAPPTATTPSGPPAAQQGEHHCPPPAHSRWPSMDSAGLPPLHPPTPFAPVAQEAPALVAPAAFTEDAPRLTIRTRRAFSERLPLRGSLDLGTLLGSAPGAGPLTLLPAPAESGSQQGIPNPAAHAAATAAAAHPAAAHAAAAAWDSAAASCEAAAALAGCSQPSSPCDPKGQGPCGSSGPTPAAAGKLLAGGLRLLQRASSLNSLKGTLPLGTMGDASRHSRQDGSSRRGGAWWGSEDGDGSRHSFWAAARELNVSRHSARSEEHSTRGGAHPGVDEGSLFGDGVEDECGICFGDEPCVRPVDCTHALCVTCAEQMLESTPAAKEMLCPFCRAPVTAFRACGAAARGE